MPIVFLFCEKEVPKIDFNLLSRKIAEKIQFIKDPDRDFTLQIFWWHLFALLRTNTTHISAYVQCTNILFEFQLQKWHPESKLHEAGQLEPQLELFVVLN